MSILETCFFSKPRVFGYEESFGTISRGLRLTRRARPPTLPQPKLASQVSSERFDEFLREWAQFKASLGLEQGQLTSYLLNSCENSLKTDIQSAVVNVTERTEAEILGYMRQHAVLSRAKSSLLTELLSMRQDQDETVCLRTELRL